MDPRMAELFAMLARLSMMLAEQVQEEQTEQAPQPDARRYFTQLAALRPNIQGEISMGTA